MRRKMKVMKRMPEQKDLYIIEFKNILTGTRHILLQIYKPLVFE